MIFVLTPNAVPQRINSSPIQDTPAIRRRIILVHNTEPHPITVPSQQLIIHKQRNTIADRTDTVSHFKLSSLIIPISIAQSCDLAQHSPN